MTGVPTVIRSVLLMVCLVLSASAHADNKHRLTLLLISIGDPDANVRAQAIRSIGALGSDADSAVPYLATAANDADPEVRYAAALAFDQVKSSSVLAISTLSTLLSDPSGDVRRQAARALGDIGAPALAAVPVLLADIRGPHLDSQVSALEALAQIATDASSALPVLLPIAQERTADSSARRAAITCLGKLAEHMTSEQRRRVVPVLAAAVNSAHATIRSAALSSLATVAESRDFPGLYSAAILRSYDDPDEDVRLSLIQLIQVGGYRDVEEVHAIVLKAAQDPYWKVRVAVQETLRIYIPSDGMPLDTLPATLAALKDPVSEVRYAALEELRFIPGASPTICSQVVSSVNDRDEVVRADAVDLLGDCSRGPPMVWESLLEATQDRSWGVRQHTMQALNMALVKRTVMQASETSGAGQVFDHSIYERMQAAVANGLNDPDQTVREAAAKALPSFVPLGANLLTPIKAAVESPFDEVHLTGIQILATYGEEANEAVPSLTHRATQDSSAEVRAAAIESLGFVAQDPRVAVPIFQGVLGGNDRASFTGDAPVELYAIRGLGRAGDNAARAIPQLISVLRSGNKYERSAALKTLSFLGAAAVGALQNAVVLDTQSQKPSDTARMPAITGPQIVSPYDLEQLKALQQTASLRLSTPDGRQEEVVVGPKTVAISVATWCEHSKALIKFLNSKHIQRMTQGWNFIFVFADEWPTIEAALEYDVEKGKLSPADKAGELASLRARAGNLPVYDPSVLATVSGHAYVWTAHDSPEFANKEFPAFFSPAARRFERSGGAADWLKEDLGIPSWLVDPVQW